MNDKDDKPGLLRSLAGLVAVLMVPSLLLAGVAAIVSDFTGWDLAMRDIDIPKDRYVGVSFIMLAGVVTFFIRFGGHITAFMGRHRRVFLGGGAVVVVGLVFGGGALITAIDGGPAVVAAMEGDTETLEHMFSEGEVQSEDHNAMVMWAAQKGHVDTMRLLMHHELNPEAARDDGLSALQAACSWGGPDTVAVLKAAGADGECS
ncbi:MAG: ankyrin repeat domain-containing protein [Nannocystaceae bacterium]|nr:ankyrin repeat domain-containing protein [Nannocystaceae bacterium]